jgi:hypothetical protein
MPLSFAGTFPRRAGQAQMTLRHIQVCNRSQYPISSDWLFLRKCETAGFKALGAAILEYPLLASHCQFIFVPGPNDPWSSTTLPRPEIPETFTQYIRDKIPKATFTSNPARIQYFNQEIVIFREDLMGRMLRNLVSVKDEAGDMRRFVSAPLLSLSVSG